MTPEAARKWLEDQNIKFILAQFVDIHGAAKAKAVPVSHLDDLLTAGAGFAGFAVWGLGMGPHGPDYMAVGDPSTLMPIPWMPGYARMACYGHVHGKAYAYDSRAALKSRLDKLKALGMTLYTGIEPEFMLLQRRADGAVTPYDHTDTLEKPCYDYKGLSRGAAFLERLVESLQAVGFDVYQIDHEDANGQFEINYTFSDCLTSADRLIFFKMAASEIANQMGMVCSFMPKPFSNRTGTGAHFHISLVGRALSGATWASAYITYGDNNRTCMVRIPHGRLEMRLPDGSCNPYLASLAILAAGLDGMRKEMDPGEPNNTDLYEWSAADLRQAGIGILPQNLNEALDALEADDVLCEGIGPDLAKEFVRLKRMEWVEYQRHVSAWEVERYLEFF